MSRQRLHMYGFEEASTGQMRELRSVLWVASDLSAQYAWRLSMHTTRRLRWPIAWNRIGAMRPASKTIRRQLGAFANSSAIARAVDAVSPSRLAPPHPYFRVRLEFPKILVSPQLPSESVRFSLDRSIATIVACLDLPAQSPSSGRRVQIRLFPSGERYSILSAITEGQIAACPSRSPLNSRSAIAGPRLSTYSH